MKLQILSDLHLSVAPMALPAGDADVVILAGDIARPQQAIEWARGFSQPVVYVPGNHEFYGSSLGETLRALRQLAEGTNVHVLDCEAVVIDGVRFLGTTLWTDFALYDAAGKHDDVLVESIRFVRDFTRIRVAEPAADGTVAPYFSPADSAALCARNVAWLREQLTRSNPGQATVIVTHHAPSPKSIHPRFADSLVNPAFISDLDTLVAGSGAALWVHGHTHDSFDYRLGDTRVVCNPRGYAFDGRIENAAFDPGFCATV
ncbi:metallophosphoesterase [Pandoraea terrae]|uniref:metallophosphoesterase n=1 Tax=Pandoraea terrae TaxID=1537710 RepID=UPI00123F360B|nr:metallophosphoesterase [Pandoraea terrae]